VAKPRTADIRSCHHHAAPSAGSVAQSIAQAVVIVSRPCSSSQPMN
jgi:hypothetical protein